MQDFLNSSSFFSFQTITFEITSIKELLQNLKKHSITDKQKGVYKIYAKKCDTFELIYIGKAGSVDNSGKFYNQGLLGRLTNYRDITFEDMLKEYSVLKFEIVITPKEILPAFLEAYYIQEYFFKYKKLPKFNKKF
ncbi:hypothetical protein [Caminibacter pacificus]